MAHSTIVIVPDLIFFPATPQIKVCRYYQRDGIYRVLIVYRNLMVSSQPSPFDDFRFLKYTPS